MTDKAQLAKNFADHIEANAGAIFAALDDLHVLIAKTAALEKGLSATLGDGMPVPSTIRLPLLEMEKAIDRLYTRTYYGLDQATQARLAERGIVTHDWHNEFLGTKTIAR